MVQRRAARFVTSRHHNRSSVSDMLEGLNWRSLEDRRKYARLCMLYKIDRQLVAIKKDRRLTSPKRRSRNRFQVIGCKTDRFFPRTVWDWNALLNSDSLCAFKARLSTMQTWTSLFLTCKFDEMLRRHSVGCYWKLSKQYGVAMKTDHIFALSYNEK